MRFNAIFTRRKGLAASTFDTAFTIVLRAALDSVPCISRRLSRSTSASGSPASPTNAESGGLRVPTAFGT